MPQPVPKQMPQPDGAKQALLDRIATLKNATGGAPGGDEDLPED